MNLINEILKEHSKSQKDKIVNYVNNDPKRFADLVATFLAGPYRVTQRASWPLSYCVERNPGLIKPHLKKIIDFLEKPNEHDAVKRNILRVFQFILIPKSQQGKAVDLCLSFLTDGKQPVAIKVFAMTVLGNIAKENADLKNEIVLIIEDQLPYGSAGFVSRARKTLKQLKQ
jgi:hypothetical protein